MTTPYRLMLKWSRYLCTSANLTATEVRSLYEARREEILSEYVLPFHSVLVYPKCRVVSNAPRID